MASSRYVYKCTSCGKVTPRDSLTVKKAVFLKMGAGGDTIKSRVLHWLCKACLFIDVDFTRPVGEHNKEVSK